MFVQKSGSIYPTVLERADGKITPMISDSDGNNTHCNIRYQINKVTLDFNEFPHYMCIMFLTCPPNCMPSPAL